MKKKYINVMKFQTYVRNNINFQIRADLSPSNIERLTTKITRPRSQQFLVTATWYKPQHSHLLTF